MQSCVHRDLKLENILLDRHENVKLVDFGFTREYEGRTNHLQTFCGTICYSAPEMLKGEKYAGEKVDVWSLGIILYALLCGELPFDDDDDNVTRTRIISEEPKFPDHIPPDTVSLIKSLLSKRPFPRPSLPDILNHPFLSEHAAAQQVILTKGSNTPFCTALETDCLQRMRSAGVDIDAVIESVLAQKVDALAGWWTLLLEKERRKMKRRERKRRERDSESKSLRRLSAASSRMERMGSMLQDVDEDGGLTSQFIKLGEMPGSRTRGRSERRSAHYYGDLGIPDLPQVSEVGSGPTTSDDIPPTPVDKDSIRSVSTSRHRRPIPPPKEGVIRSARSRGSTLHLVTTSEALGEASSNSSQANSQPKAKKKPSQAIIAHWKNWTHWIFENTTRRRKGHERRTSRSVPNLHEKAANGLDKDGKVSPRPQTSKYPTSGSPGATPTAALPKGMVANGHATRGQATPSSSARSGGQQVMRTPSGRQIVPPRISTAYKRQSLSPTPMTPRSSMRRSSAGLRGRKSTSSSLSSVRSIHHHHHTHSKASSTSSTGSVATSKTPMHRGHSPHHSSVKVLPATPSNSSPFPSNIRLVRASPAPLSLFNEGMPANDGAPPGSPNPFASGVQFAKRKKNLFKGPSLNFGGGSRATSSNSHSRNTSASGLGRRSGEITIQEEDEDYVSEEEIEEVEVFNPIVRRPGEIVEEEIIEDSEPTPTKAKADDAASNQNDQSTTTDDTITPPDQPTPVEARA